MHYNVGEIVNYNGENFVVLSSQEQVFNNVPKTYLHLKNIITDDVLNVDAASVRKIDLQAKPAYNTKKNSFDEFESAAAEAERDLIEDETQYIQSLFASVGTENTDDFFNVENSMTIDEVNDQIQREKATEALGGNTNTPDNLVQNFLPPNSSMIKPRRHSGYTEQLDNAVNATFSDLQVAAILPTREFEPTKNDNLDNLQNTPQIQPRRSRDVAPTIVTTPPPEVVAEPTVPKPSEESHDATMMIEDAKELFYKDITELIQKEATNVEQMIEPGFSESAEDDVTITSETNKMILDGLNDKANRFKERQRELLATRLVSTKQLEDQLNYKTTSVLEELEGDLDDKLLDTNPLIDTKGLDPEAILKGSKSYTKFRTMTGWIIALVFFLLFCPIVGVVLKIGANYVLDLDQPFKVSNVFSDITLHISGTSAASILSFAFVVLFFIVTPVLAVVNIIYLTVYVVTTLKKQFKRLAFFNYQVQKNASLINAMQDFNSESSVFMIKLHNDNKVLKRQLKKISRLSGLEMVKRVDKNTKEVH